MIRQLYHHLLPANLRGRLGIGRALSRQVHAERNYVVGKLACHAPFNSGDAERYSLTLDAAATCYKNVLNFLQADQPRFFSNRRASLDPSGSSHEANLEHLLKTYGSDKAGTHSYHLLYAQALNDPYSIASLLEIGISRSNHTARSDGPRPGIPGPSLRAWRSYLPNATIYGADIDGATLFQDDCIVTHAVDQLSPTSLAALAQTFNEKVDVIIDDGLHSIQANLNTIQMALGLCKPMGWIFVEDIFEPQASFFLVLSWMLHCRGIESVLYAFPAAGMVFAISPGRRLEAFPHRAG